MRIYKYNKRLIYLCAAVMLPIMAYAQIEDVRAAFDARHLVAYLVAAFLISVFVMLFYNRLYYFREQQVSSDTERMNAQLAMILESSKTQTWTYNVDKKTFSRFLEHGQKETVYIPIDFAQFYDRDDFQNMRKIIQDISNWESRFGSLTVKSVADKEADGKVHIYNVTISILRYDQRNKPVVLLGTQQDITEDQKMAASNRELALMYHTVFNTSLINMVYFDANGVLTEINDRACESMSIKDKQSLLDKKLTLADLPALNGLDFNKLDKMYTSSCTKIGDIERPMGSFEEGQDRVYYEQSVSTFRDHQGALSGVVLAGRDITDMVLAQHREKAATQQLKKTTEDIETYIRNINYSLKVSDVRLIPQEHNKAERLFCRMDRRHPGGFSETLRTIIRDKEGRDVYLNFRMMPIENKEGEITHYVGMCRNETEMTYTEMKLQEESAKAQETEQLKNSFLLNMSYELRTPLNAVIGFAGLYNGEHSEEDEPVFAEEIRKNTGTLLQLINDILFISRLDAKMIEHNYQLCDFAMMFEGWCYMGWSNVSPNVKTIVENPYNQLRPAECGNGHPKDLPHLRSPYPGGNDTSQI